MGKEQARKVKQFLKCGRDQIHLNIKLNGSKFICNLHREFLIYIYFS